jgi:signal peptidase I
MIVFRSSVADWNQIPSASMLPSMMIGDRVVVDKLAYGLRVPLALNQIFNWGDPNRSDIVTFLSPLDNKLLIKRVIGVPGDRVGLEDNKLIINGFAAEYRKLSIQTLDKDLQIQFSHTNLFSENILGNKRRILLFREPKRASPAAFETIVVPAEHYLLLGDNRDDSSDYRMIGFVPRSAIIGRATLVAFSLDYANYYLPRNDRFLTTLQ